MWRKPEYLTPNPSLHTPEAPIRAKLHENPERNSPDLAEHGLKTRSKPPRSVENRSEKRWEFFFTDLSIDGDLSQPLSPTRIDRRVQARAWRRRTAATRRTTTRSEKGQEDIYEG
jgi:hypothetical protein